MKFFLRFAGIMFFLVALIAFVFARKHYIDAVYCDEQIRKQKPDIAPGLILPWPDLAEHAWSETRKFAAICGTALVLELGSFIGASRIDRWKSGPDGPSAGSAAPNPRNESEEPKREDTLLD